MYNKLLKTEMKYNRLIKKFEIYLNYFIYFAKIALKKGI